MTSCISHPERPAERVCMKYRIDYGDACARCQDPKRYGKHPTACPIWFVAKDSEDGWG